MGGPSRESKGVAPHDEAFKKLLQTFFAEFLELFFPEVNELLDYRHTRLLMQELLVDVVGEEARILDLLVETRYRATDAYILVHLEPQSYRQDDFHERMFIYFSRLFERHRRQHKLVIPIAIFTSDQARDEPDTYAMEIPGHEIVKFRFLKVELRGQDWRKFVDSDNPVAAALLAKMGYNERDKNKCGLLICGCCCDWEESWTMHGLRSSCPSPTYISIPIRSRMKRCFGIWASKIRKERKRSWK